jgi:predicted kinase
MLWENYSGTPEGRSFREAVCSLVRYHGLPLHAAMEDSGKRRLLMVAALGQQIPEFSIRMLCLLAQADVLGRICPDRQELLDRVELCRLLAKELGCYVRPYGFPTPHTRFMYLNDHYDLPEYPLYDDTWGPVILLSGLPGTGKDTFAASHYPDLPMISLDEIRRELGVLPEESQMRVVDTANERAKAYLRRKEPFLWNATNLSPRIRQRIIGMMTDYKASVRIEFLETSWEEGLRRNAQRSRQVPEQAIGRMLQELVPPQPWEAGEVRWHCI